MHGRGLHILLLVYVGWWFVWFAPSHPRGKMLVLGSSEGCCATEACPPSSGDDSGKPFQGTPDKQCAVCFLVAHMDVPQQADLSMPFQGLCHVLDWPRPLGLVHDAVTATRFGRAPPVSL